MPVNRSLLKNQSRVMIAESKPRPTNVAMLMTVLMIIVATLGNKLLLTNLSVAEIERYLQYVQNNYFEGALELLYDNRPSNYALLINQLLQWAVEIVSVGFVIFTLNTIRRNAPVVANLLDGFAILWRLIVLYFFIGLFTALWSMLFIIPGIIASYRYRMAIYLLIDHPEMSPLECIRESKRMMRGHKWELFCLDFSFIGWTFLEGLGYAGYFVMIYTLPYKAFTYALYYEALCGKSYDIEFFKPAI